MDGRVGWRARPDAGAPHGQDRVLGVQAAKGGRLSADQKEIIAKLEALGHVWAVVLDIDDARRELQRYGVRTREATYMGEKRTISQLRAEVAMLEVVVKQFEEHAEEWRRRLEEAQAVLDEREFQEYTR